MPKRLNRYEFDDIVYSTWFRYLCSYGMKPEIVLANERASLSRPGWTSEQKTGMFSAHNHYHCGRKDCPVVVDYYKKSKGVI